MVTVLQVNVTRCPTNPTLLKNIEVKFLDVKKTRSTNQDPVL